MGNKKSFEHQMQEFRLMIWNAADDSIIATRIAPLGYTAEELTKGKELYLEVENLSNLQRKEYSEQYNASNAYTEAIERIESYYRKLRKFTKYVYADNQEIIDQLKLDKIIPRQYPKWYAHLSQYFETMLKDENLLSPLVPFGFTKESVQTVYGSLLELKELQQKRTRELGDAQQATQARDAKFDELKTYCQRLRDLLKLIYEDEDSQYLEKLGILVRS